MRGRMEDEMGRQASNRVDSMSSVRNLSGRGVMMTEGKGTFIECTLSCGESQPRQSASEGHWVLVLCWKKISARQDFPVSIELKACRSRRSDASLS
jgi:hypothetical protein